MEENQRHDEQLVSRSLRSLGEDAAPVSQEAVDRANQRAGDAFAHATGSGKATSPDTDQQASVALASKFRRTATKESPSWLTLPRLSVALIVFAVVAILFFANKPDPAVAKQYSFGEILDKQANADSLQMRILRDGAEADVWVRGGREVRWEESKTNYLIAKGSRLWRIDEASSKIEDEENPWLQDESRRIDLLSLLGVDSGKDQAFRKAMPVASTKRKGKPCHVYRFPLQDGDRHLEIEAFVDAETQQLYTITAWPEEADKDMPRQGPPLAELRLIARNAPVDEGKFVVAKWLSQDGRLGKIVDHQGIITVKPVMHARWTPVVEDILLMPGDWLRTDKRGANAVALQMVNGTQLTLGPGTMIELLGPRQVRVLGGELQVKAAEKTDFELLGEKQESIKVVGKKLLRLTEDGFQELSHAPVWLAGFEGTQSNESLGSLIANVDGRNVPLTLGYHKVTVEIRDQIARTTIEQSFVNHTNSRLEGVFYFPLPQDASISGFGMWIGNELVEADVVERQRAREIYETIRRERRDPALLEWAGGNIFKASVFPIFGNSEKRIKITYTQVLPVRGGRYRYSYGLRSELLKQTPLRELSLDLKVSSTLPIESIDCPTHPARTDKTQHAGHVEFSAQEYSPTRDFEVVIDVGGEQSDVVVIPHRRGDDGYFMLQLTPPADAGEDKRDVVPDGKPLNLLIVADTSASMDKASRELQADFITSLLSSLGPKDHFNLAVADVECQWAFQMMQAATDNVVDHARQFLGKRESLGWSDLDKAFQSVGRLVGENTHVIYVGDGIVTTTTADPTEFVNRFERTVAKALKVPATFHAVTVGSSFEPVVLKAIASVGGGSFRRVTGDLGPQATARELLGEIAKPGLSDLEIDIRGVRVARVYPQRLPNIAAGAQQIIIGRYLPEGRDQKGEVIVTGKQGDKPVRYKARFELNDAEHGNSFIPRLWARLHLDTLLSQGISAETRDEIIGLSEEYHIITPYTSLLVLESDADRERFKVKRRFQMRDGEKYFAEGRANANYELQQKQMKKAGLWRLALRQQILRQLATLGRDATLLNPSYYSQLGHAYVLGKDGAQVSAFNDRGWVEGKSKYWGSENEKSRPTGEYKDVPSKNTQSETPDDALNVPEMPDMDFEMEPPIPRPAESQPTAATTRPSDLASLTENALAGGKRATGGSGAPGPAMGDYQKLQQLGNVRQPIQTDRQLLRLHWLSQLMPVLPEAVAAPKPPESNWPEEAIELSKSLLRRNAVKNHKGGVELMQTVERFDPHWDRVTSHSEMLWLYSNDAWLSKPLGKGVHTLVNWCDGKERGAFSKAFLLGQVREADPADNDQVPANTLDHSWRPLHETHATWNATVESVGNHRQTLILTSPDGNSSYRLLIDTRRDVVLEAERTSQGKRDFKRICSDFVEAAGQHWAQQIKMFNADEKVLAQTTQRVVQLDVSELASRFEQELSDRRKVQFVRLPLPTLADSQHADKNEQATFEHHLLLMVHFARSQQWKQASEHLAAAEKLAEGKPGMRWLRYLVLRESRKFGELREALLAEATTLSEANDDFFLAQYILGQMAYFAAANEQLEILDRLKPVFDRQPPYVAATRAFRQRRIGLLNSAAQRDELLKARQAMARDFPYDSNVHLNYANALVSYKGDYKAAVQCLREALKHADRWDEYQANRIRSTLLSYLDKQGRRDESLDLLRDWVQDTENTGAPFGRYLSALVLNDEVEEAERLMLLWITQAIEHAAGVKSIDDLNTFYKHSDQRMPARMFNQLNAAVQMALGRTDRGYSNTVKLKWMKPLAKVVLALARNQTHYSLASLIMSNTNFSQSDEGIKVRRQVVQLLQEEVERLEIVELGVILGWAMSGQVQVEREVWIDLASRLEARWAAEESDATRHSLGASIANLLSTKVSTDEYLRFLRHQHLEGPEAYRIQYANQLFETLLRQLWNDKFEAEACGLLDELTEAATPAEHLAQLLPKLYRLTDRMVHGRYEAGLRTVDQETKSNRIAFRRKKRELLREARNGYAQRLERQIKLHNETLAKWLRIEQLYLLVRLEDDLDKVVKQCKEFLGDAPPPLEELAKKTPLATYYDDVLHYRYLTTASYLATLKSTHEAIAEHVLKYIDAGIKQTAPPAKKEKEKVEDDAAAREARHVNWKTSKYNLLIALDRPKELEKLLRSWIEEGWQVSRWRVALGRLLAEQGRIEDAVKLYAAVEDTDQLTPDQYRSLADWYMVLNRRDDYERAKAGLYMTMQEWHLQNQLQQQLVLYQRTDGSAPATLDPEVLLMFRALLEKSTYPQNYLSYLGRFYGATKDFRLLEFLPSAALGHTSNYIYGFLSSVNNVTSQVLKEATIDTIKQRLEIVRQQVKTSSDQRALDLLELMVERRAAELDNQAKPHIRAALAAMKRAFDRKWSEGEHRLMATFLSQLGRITDKSLHDEQLRQMRELHDLVERGSYERLEIAALQAKLMWSYGQRDEALTFFESAIDEYDQANDRRWPQQANPILQQYVSLLESARWYMQAEKLLLDHYSRPANAVQALFFRSQLDGLYHRALQRNALVSVGRGADLYKYLVARLLKHLETSDDAQTYGYVHELCSVFRTGHGKKFPSVKEDVRTFAFERIPKILESTTNNYQNVISTTAQAVHNLIDPATGVLFLVERIENELPRVQYQYGRIWYQSGSYLAHWRTQAKSLDKDLQDRLLKIVLAELRRDLEARQQTNRSIYSVSSYFWAEKKPAFVEIADAMAAKHKQSGAAVAYIANYFAHGLQMYPRAIALMFEAYRAGRLDDNQIYTLVNYLDHEQRFAETIPLLRPLVERYPGNLRYRTMLMHMYYRTGSKDELLALLKDTHDYFHQGDRWTEQVMVTLAGSCQANELFEQAAGYYEEAIGHHQRTQPNRGIGNGTLSGYFATVASIYQKLGRTKDAVDAAAGAVVSWGASRHNRTYALQSLTSVLQNAKDRDEYATFLDKEAERTAQDRPIVRKALGQAYVNLRQYDKAVVQLKIAVQYQPNDKETHNLLISSYDALDDKAVAIDQLLALTQGDRRNIGVYRNLGDRLADKPQRQERAYTSIVEVKPNEADSHTLLAEIRQRQDRWDDAIEHWKQVHRIRSLEPTGLLKLAAAQLHQKQWDAAGATLDELEETNWPARFSNVRSETSRLRGLLNE